MPLKLFKTFKWGEKFKITRIRYEDGVQLFEKGDTTGNTVYINQDNMYIVNQEQIDNIYNALKDLEFYSFEGECIIDPALDTGDIVVIDGKNVIYQGSMQFSGRWIANIESKIQCKAKEETTTRTLSQKTINRRVQSQINQVDGKITQLAEETTENTQKIAQQEIETSKITNTVSEIDTKLTNNYLTSEQVKNEFDNTKNNIEILKQKQVEASHTADDLQIKITKIEDDGVSKVKTEKGFTFDDDGLTIDELNSKVKSKFTENGMEVLDKTSGNEEVLLKAGYDATAGETIVKSKNMVVEKYLTIGANTRFEDYVNPTLGGKGTGAFTL